MSSSSDFNISLTGPRLWGRTFLLGNKRAFSLSLPAASGKSDAFLHRHKWFGGYLYGRKYFESQVLRTHGEREQLLGADHQTGFVMAMDSARREYVVEGETCTEEYFVPDGVQGFATILDSPHPLSIEPQLDMRHFCVLSQSSATYEVEVIDRGVVISNVVPEGSVDDVSESFTASHDQSGAVKVYAVIQAVGDGARCELLPPRRHARRKRYRKDQQRQRLLAHSAPADAVHDHAPLWKESACVVYSPARLWVHGHGAVVYGFGTSRDEAVQNMEQLRDNLVQFQVQKAETTKAMLERAHFRSGSHRIDTAYTHVLTRIMDGLVARNVAMDNTALERPTTMILAGNQYFHDSWKRDENIALGFLITLGFYDLAREVICDSWQLQDGITGRLPQRIRPGEEAAYRSSDGTLWALLRLYQYWRCTGDESVLHDKLPMVRTFFQRSLERSVDGLLPSGRTSSQDYLWETWMDTQHTPRHGFPVEIQMLWIVCLRLFRPVLQAHDAPLEDAMRRAEAAAWLQLPRYDMDGMFADSLDEEGHIRDLITPNPYFCFGVGLDLGPEVEHVMRLVGRRQLAGRQGIITLAPDQWNRVFPDEFLRDRRRVRGRRMLSVGKFNYHRGVEWNWLSQFFVQAELKYGDSDAAFSRYLKRQVDAALDVAGIGGISELVDLSGTRGPEFQAWSMSGFLQALHAFAGVRIDVPSRCIAVQPQVPASWGGSLEVRKWYGGVPFDLTAERDGGTTTVKVDFPWDAPQDVTVDLSVVLPVRRVVTRHEVMLDGVPQAVDMHTEPIAGTEMARVSVAVPACRNVQLSVGTARATARAPLSA